MGFNARGVTAGRWWLLLAGAALLAVGLQPAAAGSDLRGRDDRSMHSSVDVAETQTVDVADPLGDAGAGTGAAEVAAHAGMYEVAARRRLPLPVAPRAAAAGPRAGSAADDGEDRWVARLRRRDRGAEAPRPCDAGRFCAAVNAAGAARGVVCDMAGDALCFAHLTGSKAAVVAAASRWDAAVVEFVERDMAVWTDQAAAAPFPSPWHLDRLDAAGGVAALDGVFDTGQTGAGEGVHIYVLDTGLDEGHAEFAGRVGRGYTKFGPDPNAVVDVNGHGTHCAGIAAGARNGVAKRATVHGVQVLDAEGLGSFEDVLEGLLWVRDHGERPAVVSLSIAGPVSATMNAAIRDMHELFGVLVVAAAGNQASDACAFSPGNSPDAIVVGSSDILEMSNGAYADAMSGFSNFGRCVDVYAPGSRVRAAAAGSGDGFDVRSGTSMACPAVAGIAALYLAEHPGSAPAAAKRAVLDAALPVRNGALFFPEDPAAVLAGVANLDVCAFDEPVADCRVAPWSRWAGECPAPATACGAHHQTRTRSVVREPRCGGAACGALRERRPCPAAEYAPCTTFYPVQWFGSAAPETSPRPQFDLGGTTLRFFPRDGGRRYAVCREAGAALPPEALAGAERLRLEDDDFAEIVLRQAATAGFPFFGEARWRIFVGSNGYVTFGVGDTSWTASSAAGPEPLAAAAADAAEDWSGGALPIAQHWALPRVSLLYQDLDPTAAAAAGDGRAGGVWYEVRGGGDPKVVVTFLRVPVWGFAEYNTVQAVLHLAGSPRAGEIEVWYDAEVSGRYSPVVGLSPGNVSPASLGDAFEPTDFGGGGAPACAALAAEDDAAAGSPFDALALDVVAGGGQRAGSF